MSQFKYQLPSGAVFLVDAPQGTTQGQADLVFYTQVAAGVFAGYSAGQTLTSVATRLAEFNLSRIERDTAGVENATVLSIIEQSPVIAPVPDVSKVPLQNPITAADIAQLDLNAIPSIGPLPPEQVAALIAQIKNLPKPEGSVTAYGFTCSQLESVGVFKPGVCSRDTFSCCLKSPDSWTGNYNINSYNDLINNETAQVQIQAALLQNSYDSLTQAGIIQATPQPAISLTTGEVWVNGRGLVEATAAGVLTGQTKSGSTLFNQIYGAVSGTNGIQTALGAVTLAGAGLNSVNSLINSGSQNISSALGIANTVANLGTSVTSIANNLVNTNLSSLAGQGVSVLTNTINGGINSITNTVAGSVGALMTNASQFGTAITGLWAGGGLTGSIGSLGGLASNLGLGGVASGINSVTNLAGSLSSGVSSLTNGLTGLSNLSSLNSLTGLTSGAIGNLGSLISGSGISGLASSLTGSASSALGSLSGLASGALGSATELVQGTLGNLGSLASDSLGSLTSSLDLAGKMSSFSIDFSIFSNSGLANKVQKAPAFTNTVDRATVDVAFQQILGNPKIPVPNFEVPPNISTAAAQLDINYAKNILQSITSPVTNVIGQATAIAGQAQQLATNVGGAINRLTG